MLHNKFLYQPHYLLFLLVFLVSCNNQQTSTHTAKAQELQATGGTTASWQTLIQAADKYAEQGDMAQAKKLASRAAALVAQSSQKSPAMLLTLGKANQYQQRFQKAQYYYRQVLKTDPDNYEANFGAGYCNFQLELYQEAVPFLAKSNALRPAALQVKFYLARSSQKVEQGVTKRILQLYEQSAAVEKQALLYLAEVYRHNTYTNRAIKHYELYLNRGGTLNRETQQWLEAERGKRIVVAQVATTSPQPESSGAEPDTSESTPSSPSLSELANMQQEVLKVCPKCGRLGEKDAEICEYDGEPLEESL